MAANILLIPTDDHIARKVGWVCQQLGAELTEVHSADEAARCLEERSFDLVLCDYEAFNRLHDRFPRACVMLVSEPADSEQAIEAIKHGALDYVVRPVEPQTLLAHVRDCLRVSHDVRVPAVYEARDDDDDSIERIIGQSPPMKAVYKLIGLIAPRDINVLITGESGTGKEMVARAIYHHSPRRERPFLAVNCAAIPETLLESELFGHERGAFTGADHRRIGKFEQCNGGTLFLDEIGDIPLATQAKLLRVLQDNTFQRLGGSELVRCDVRIIAATNQPLTQLIHERRFRQDLYYRLKVASIEVPPLRERAVDVALLAHYFVRRLNARMGTRIQRFAPEVLSALLRYPWPGNVRELENVMKASLVVARGAVFRLEFLPEHLRGAAETAEQVQANGHAGNGIGTAALSAGNAGAELARFASALAHQSGLNGTTAAHGVGQMERAIICAYLNRTGGQLAMTARLLGISRTTLRKKMSELGIRVASTAAYETIRS